MPMHRWMHSAAGGTNHRLKPAVAIILSRSRMPKPAEPAGIARSNVVVIDFPQDLRFSGALCGQSVWRRQRNQSKNIDRPIENLDNDAAERLQGLCNQSASDGASRLASATSAAVKGFMGLRASTTKPML